MCKSAFAVLLSLAVLIQPVVTMAQDKIGVLMLHGKSPGNPNTPSMQMLKSRLEVDGAIVFTPDMPWSASRYIDGDLTKGWDEIASHLEKLKQRGAVKLFIAGHSMGAAIGLAYAAQRGGVDGVVMLAPGHAPYYYYNSAQQGPNVAVKASIDEARALVAAGQGDTRKDFMDNNQGKALAVRTTAKAYLSYFDPEGMGDMAVAAAKQPAEIPVLIALGDQDPLTTVGRSYIFDRLKPNPKNQYLAISANHLNTPAIVKDEVAAWIKATAQ